MQLRSEKLKPHSQTGSVLALLLVVTVVISVVGFVVSSLISQVMTSLGDEDIQLEAQMLASDLKEYTKYLLAYEKIMFIDNPLRLEDGRRNNMIQLWRETGTQVDYSKNLNIANTCGGFEYSAGFLGNLSLDGHRVFCPVLMRQPDLTTRDLQDLYMNNWARPGSPTQLWRNSVLEDVKMTDVFETTIDGNPLPDGWYRIRLKFNAMGSGTSDPDWFLRDENIIPVFVGQKIFELHRDTRLDLEVTAEVIIDMFTDSMGFSGKLSERFFKITSIVNFNSSGSRGPFIETESFVLRTPTLKDFSLFIPYPTKIDGDTPTKLFSESMIINRNSTIRGRVFFNGDIDVPLSNLPIFFDTVFITGNYTLDIPPSDLALFRNKFRRGLITNVSGSRFIFDGDCVDAGDPFKQDILNGSGIACKDSLGRRSLDAYPGFQMSGCKCWPLVFNPSVGGKPGKWEYKPQATPGVPCEPMTDRATCNVGLDGDAATGTFMSVGLSYMDLPSTAFILAPVKKLTATKPSTVYGTIIGGHISAAARIDVFPLTEMRAGLPGIGSAALLSQLSAEANRTQGGVSAPLPNFPLIQHAKDGFK